MCRPCRLLVSSREITGPKVVESQQEPGLEVQEGSDYAICAFLKIPAGTNDGAGCGLGRRPGADGKEGLRRKVQCSGIDGVPAEHVCGNRRHTIRTTAAMTTSTTWQQRYFLVQNTVKEIMQVTCVVYRGRWL